MSGRSPVSGQEFVGAVDGMTVGHPRQDVGDPGLRFDVVQFRGGDQGADGGPPVGATVGAGEEMVLAPKRDRADDTLDRIDVEVAWPSSRKRQRAGQRASA